MPINQDSDPINALEAELAPRLAEARQRLSELDVQVRTFVVERPLLALGAAVLVGYLIARVALRR